MLLQPVNEQGESQESEAGSIASLSDALFTEYGLSGYSLTPEDVETALIADFKVYAAWGTTTAQLKGTPSQLNRDYVISLSEWGLIEPVIRAHCELIQAQRVEGTGSLGGERFGLSVSEATANYKEAKEDLKKNAFVEAPFTFIF